MKTVQLWYVRPEGCLAPGALAGWSRFLSREERERAARFVFERDRQTFVAAHAMLRLSLSRCARVRPELLRFRTGPHGRPEIAGPEEALGLRFSLSHTTGLAACAITAGVPVGVDVEAIGRRAPLEIADRCCAPGELAALDALPPVRQPERFLEYWTLKEAFLKALGLGLSFPLDRIGFSLAPRRPVRVELPPELGESPGAWQFGSWRLGGRYRVALAVRSDGSERRVEVGEMVGPNLLRIRPGWGDGRRWPDELPPLVPTHAPRERGSPCP